jgi:hypothetical protein
MKRVKARQTYSLFILLLSGFLIAGCGDGAKNGHWLPGGAASTADVTRPTVTAVLPLDNAVGVARNTKITAAFSEAMAPLTLIDNTIDNTTTFTVTDNASGLLVPGTVTYSGVTAVYRPTNPLAASTLPGGQRTGGKLHLELHDRCDVGQYRAHGDSHISRR